MRDFCKRLPALCIALCLMFLPIGCHDPLAEAQNPPSAAATITVMEGNSASNQNLSQATADPTATPMPVQDSTGYNDYSIVAEVDPETRTVTGVEKVIFKNRTGMALDQVYFNLYLNAFTRTATYQPYFDAAASVIFPAGKDYGYINITNAMINNKGAVFNTKETVLTVFFPEPLQPNAEAEITLIFDAYVPAINYRTGANDAAMWMGNFFPILALYDENGWHKGPYYPAGDPFYANIANYHVKVTTPLGYTVVGTGEEVSVESNDIKTTDITATLVRDFAFVIGREYKVDTLKTQSGGYVNLYHFTETENTGDLLNVAVRWLDAYSTHIGSYPYTSLDIVEVGALPIAGGISYPGIAFVDATYFHSEAKQEWLAKEIGHQWFYNIIGSNQVKEAWLDEGLTEYVYQSLSLSPDALAAQMALDYATLQSELPFIENPSLLQDLSVYKSWQEYHSIQHIRAKLMMYALEQKIGTEAMHTFLKMYYDRFSFRLVNRAGFTTMAEEVSQMDLDEFFRGWMEDFTLPPL